MMDDAGLDQVRPEHNWFYDVHRSDPVVSSLAYVATRGPLCVDFRAWRNHKKSRDFIGSTMAYYLAHMNMGTLDRLDADAPVTHSAKIVRPPQGEAPDSVKEAVVGLRGVYVREELQHGSNVSIHPLDFYLHLMWHGKVEAAAWYRQYMNDRLREGQRVRTWDFSPDDMPVAENPMSGDTYRYYKNPFSLSLLGVLSTFHLIVPNEDWLGSTKPIDRPSTWRAKDPIVERQAETQRLANALGVNTETAGNMLGVQAVTAAFKRARSVREAWENDPSVGRLRCSRDIETAELTYLEVNGVVVFDSERGTDMTNDPEFSIYALHKTISYEELELLRKEQAESRKKAALRPTLPVVSDEKWMWHLQRIVNGL